jgi:hypothetical protein
VLEKFDRLSESNVSFSSAATRVRYVLISNHGSDRLDTGAGYFTTTQTPHDAEMLLFWLLQFLLPKIAIGDFDVSSN